MAAQTGENEQGLHKILELTRGASIALLLLHFYYFFYQAFFQWKLITKITDRLMQNIAHTGLFNSFNRSKYFALGLLIVSLIGAKGRKDATINYKTPITYVAIGLIFYFASYYSIYIPSSVTAIAIINIGVTSIAYILIMTGGTLLSRVLQLKMNNDDIFNRDNETFPQEERLLTNEYSINLPMTYQLKGKTRKGWINFINPFRGILISGSPGSGKTYFIIQHIIKQHIQKGFSMFVYDFKYDDLTKITYNQFLLNQKNYKIKPKFYSINFDDLSRSHRCNPLDVSSMKDITDANEAAQTVLFGLNHDWIKKQGDFWVESSINFVTAIIWFLCNYEKGKYCTLAHVIELAQVSYDKLFSVLRTEPQIEVLVTPFVTAYINDAKEQLEGQIGGAIISLSKLSSPDLYYILSGNDFTLDINDNEQPKIVCIGNNPQKSQTYSAVLSLYVGAMSRLLNKKGKHKCSLIFDEFPTIYFGGIDKLIATARSSKVSTTIAVQDASQLKLYYSKEQAEVIMNIVGNIITGQVSGDTAKNLSERFGKTMQDRQTVALNSTDTTVTYLKQLEMAIPINKIASLSSGEFVGMVADNPTEKIELKTFCCEVVNDHQSLEKEQSHYKELPIIAKADRGIILLNYLKIKKEVQEIINNEIERIMDTPQLASLIIKK
jgi:YWFCY motif protein/type IV secretory system conjugative DNA transfer VirD4/TraG family protein